MICATTRRILPGSSPALRAHIGTSQQQVDKVSVANTQGGQFISKYFMNVSEASTQVLIELNQTAKEFSR